ncbi:MAG: hypothetical protein JSW50_04315 [Candidatus Latescibacterota bacterium]|nr:MAG: hypothetical protein JSW50_04315 [Candidatus Latescibacterota bacterium]
MPTNRRRMGTDPLTWIMEDGKTDDPPVTDKPQAKTSDEGQRDAFDVLRVRAQPLSRLLADYFICSHCLTVARTDDHTGDEPQCPGCQRDTAGAGFYFTKPVHVIIDLMQDTYQSTSLTARGPTADIPQLDLGHSLALLLFFCQLFEVVQEHVLRQIMSATGIPQHAADRILADNRDPRRRVGKIFPTVTGESWRRAIEALAADRNVDYIDTLRFLKRSIDLRDAFAVTADLTPVDDELGKACILRIDPLLDLYVSIHNRYVPHLT